MGMSASVLSITVGKTVKVRAGNYLHDKILMLLDCELIECENGYTFNNATACECQSKYI